jgi:hypothetical protein
LLDKSTFKEKDMSVNGITSTAAPQFDASPISGMSRRRAEDALGRQLEAALQAGDLTAAQQAYQKLSAFGTDNSGPFKNAKFQAEFQTLGLDLQKGDLAAAQNDVGTLGKDVLTSDARIALHSYRSGNSPVDFQNAMANLKGDYWAVYGVMPTNADLRALLTNNDNTPTDAAINVQA